MKRLIVIIPILSLFLGSLIYTNSIMAGTIGIASLPETTILSGTDIFIVETNDTTKKVTFTNVSAYILARTFTKASSIADHAWQGDAQTGTAGEAISRGKLLYQKKNSGVYKWYLYDANDVTIKAYDPTGIAIADITSGADGLILIQGVMRDDTWSLTATNDTADTTIYPSTIAGGMIKTAPASSGDSAHIVGHLVADNTIEFRFGYARVVK